MAPLRLASGNTTDSAPSQVTEEQRARLRGAQVEDKISEYLGVSSDQSCGRGRGCPRPASVAMSVVSQQAWLTRGRKGKEEGHCQPAPYPQDN